MMTNLEIVREACIKANPEIMELKSGCELDLNTGESYGLATIHRQLGICKKHKKYREECSFEEDGCVVVDGVFCTSGYFDEEWWQRTVKVSEIKPHQILGRPIRLADVLLAVTEDWHRDEEVRLVFFGDQKQKYLTIAATWNLKDDDLSSQSQETIDFLASLLHTTEGKQDEK